MNDGGETKRQSKAGISSGQFEIVTFSLEVQYHTRHSSRASAPTSSWLVAKSPLIHRMVGQNPHNDQ